MMTINPMRALLAAIACVPLCWSRSAASGQAMRPPNIILIMADDVGVEAFGCYGGESYATPRIDALAAAGMRFEHCYSQPLCTPSRVQIMTGLSNVRNYVRFAVMDPTARTFGHRLQAAGYRTGVFGKWQLYGAKQEGRHAGTGLHPSRAGFDEWLLWHMDQRQSRYWDPLLTAGEEPSTTRSGDYGPDLFRDALINFMGCHREQPFFAYFPMALVHSPFVATPLSGRGDDANDARHFGEMVEYMDRIVGEIVDATEQLGVADETLILFTGDNGTNREITSRQHGRPVEGGKGLTTNAGTHVPLVAYWPGRIAAGETSERLVDFCDFVPTLLDAAGLPSERGLDGVSFYPQLLGEQGAEREWIFSYYNPRPGQQPAVRSARDRRWKLYGDGRLFDLVLDEQELTPIPQEEASPDAAVARDKLQAVLDDYPMQSPKLVE